MDPSIKDLLPLATGAVGGVGGVLGALFKSRSAVKKKLEDLKGEIDALRTRRIEDRKTFDEYRQGVRLEIEGLKAEHERDLAAIGRELHRLGDATARTRELTVKTDQRNAVQELREKVEGVEAQYDRLRDTLSQFVRSETFNHFTQEQRDQWLAVQRNLGQLEGILRKI